MLGCTPPTPGVRKANPLPPVPRRDRVQLPSAAPPKNEMDKPPYFPSLFGATQCRDPLPGFAAKGASLRWFRDDVAQHPDERHDPRGNRDEDEDAGDVEEQRECCGAGE